MKLRKRTTYFKGSKVNVFALKSRYTFHDQRIFFWSIFMKNFRRHKCKQIQLKHACLVAVNVWKMILTSAAGLPPRETHWISTSRSSVVLRVSPLTMIGFSGGTFTVKTASRDRMGETPSAMSGDKNFHDSW